MTVTYPPTVSSSFQDPHPSSSSSSSLSPSSSSKMLRTASSEQAQAGPSGSNSNSNSYSGHTNGRSRASLDGGADQEGSPFVDDVEQAGDLERRASASSMAPRQSQSHSRRTNHTQPYSDEGTSRPLSRVPSSAGNSTFSSHFDRHSKIIMAHAGHIVRVPHNREDIREMARPARIKTKQEFARRVIAIAALIGCWYFFSTLISVYNKWLFDPKKRNFPYPIFVTSIHMLLQFSIAATALLLLDRTDKVVLIPRTPDGKRRRPTAMDYVSKVLPCALATSADIGLSNESLKSITLTLYTMCKSSNLAFVLIMAFIFRLEKLRLNLVGVIGIITVGVIMMVASETKLVISGAVEVLLASMMGGLRWALTQMLLEKEKLGMTNPVAVVFWLCPIMAAGLFLTSLIVEDWSAIIASPEFEGTTRTLKTVCLLVFPGVLAFCMNLSEFALIQRTSVVTLSVAGIFKEILTVIIASAVFDDQLTAVNITGLCIAIGGIAAYNYIKWKGLNEEVASSGGAASADGYERAPMADSEVFDIDDVDGDDEEEVEGGNGHPKSNGGKAPKGAQDDSDDDEGELGERQFTLGGDEDEGEGDDQKEHDGATAHAGGDQRDPRGSAKDPLLT